MSTPDPGTQRAREIWRRGRPIMLVPLFLAGLVAALIGPVVCGLLVIRGVEQHHPSWVLLGVLCGGPWLLLVVAALRRWLRPRPGSPPAPPPPHPPRG